MTNVLEFLLKMKDMMSGGLVKVGQTAQSVFSKVQKNIDANTNAADKLAYAYNDVSSAIRHMEQNIRSSTSISHIRQMNRELSVLRSRQQEFKRFGISDGAGSSSALGLGSIAKRYLAPIAIASMLFGAGKTSIQEGLQGQARATSFQVMAGAGAGNKLNNDLTKFAQDSIYGNEVYGGAQTMMAFGIESKDVMKDTKMLGDVAMGNAERLKSLTLAFSQVSAAGKLMGQDLLQFVNAGFNPLQEISKKTGLSLAVLRDKVSEGAISFKMVEEAFESATGAGGKFYQMTDKISQTDYGKVQAFYGQMQGLAMKIGGILAPIVGSIITKVLVPLANWASTAVDFLSAGMAGLSSPTSEWASYIDTAKSIFTTIWSIIKSVAALVWDVLGGLVEWVRKSEMMKDIFSFIGWIVKIIGSTITVVVDMIKWLWDNVVKPILDAVNSIYTAIKYPLGTGGKSTSVTATSINKDNTFSDIGKAIATGNSGNSAGSEIAKGITGGGPRVINISGVKFTDKIEIHTATIGEAMDDLEDKFMMMFARLLNSGAAVQ